MFKKLFAAAVLFVLPATGMAQAVAPPPLEAYGELPTIERMALSQDGNRIAVVMKIQGEPVLVLMNDDLSPIRFVRLEDSKVRSLEWAGNDHVVWTLSRTEQLGPDFSRAITEFVHAFVVSVDEDNDPWMVFDNDPTMLNAIFGMRGIREIDGEWKIFVGGVEKERGARGYYIGSSGVSLWEIDVESGAKRQVYDDGTMGRGTAWLIDAQGEVATKMEIDMDSGRWWIKVPGGEVIADGTAPRGDVGFVVMGPQGKSVIYAELDDDEEVTTWYQLPLNSSEAPREFAKAQEIDRLYTDKATGHLIGIRRIGSETESELYNPIDQRRINSIYKAFPGLEISFADWTPGFSRALIRTSGGRDSGTWYLVDIEAGRAAALGYEREAIGPEVVGAVSTVSYKAGDGLEIEGILTLPPGRQPKNLPIVVLPHGGPHSHDIETFDWWAQAFASRGYAVFQPNFRGSTNSDEAFLRAGFGQWGKAMQTDISDGLAYLVEQGIADPKRACIMGASYGGYAALAGVTLQNGLYRCSVAVAPVADIGELFRTEREDSGRSPLLRRSLEEELGPRSGFDEISPRKQADRADAPILLIHGRNDTVVPFRQSTLMLDALRGARKSAELIELDSEDHWLSRSPTRKQMLEAAMAFILEHNPPDS